MQKKTVFSNSDVIISDKKNSYSGFFTLDTLTIQHRLFAGGWSQPMQREVFQRRAIGALLPYDPIRDEVVLIQQFRIGALAQDNPWLLEIIAGISEPDENMEAMIMREAFEEAGIVPLELIKLYEYWVSPGGSAEKLSLFCGRVDATTAFGIHGLEHENEDIQVITMSADDAINAIASGEINNAATIIALQWLKAHKKTVFRA